MTIQPRRPTDPSARRRSLLGAFVALAVALPGGAAPQPARAAEPPAADPAGGVRTTIHYEEALAHEDDRIEFEPGGRVTVGFRPRRDDRFLVGGAAPRALPAGRLDGAAMRGEGRRDRSPVFAPTAPDASAAPDASPSAGPSAEPSSDPAPSPSGDPSPTPAPTPAAGADAPILDESEVVGAEGASWTEPDAAGTVDLAAAVTPTGLRREIFGFLPYWELNASSTTLDYSKLSTIAFFGVGADGNGNLMKKNSDGSTTTGWSGWTSSKLTSIINEAHRNSTRVVLTVQSFAWSSGQLARQQQLLGSATARANLARQIAAAVRDRGADGVNLDFEPLASGYEDEFVSLVRAVRSELDAVAKGYQLTFDTTGYIGNYPIEAATATGAADAIFIMGYDYRGSSSSPVGSIAPMTRSGLDIRETVAAYAARVHPSKLILGVPYYGRAWSTDTDTFAAKNISGTKYGSSVTVVYDTAMDYVAANGRRYDATEGVAWTAYRRQNCTATYGCVTGWRQIYFDDAQALREKYDLVNQYGLRGAGIWALGYDGTRPELWAAIRDKFITDTEPPVAGIDVLPPISRNPGVRVSWTGTDDAGVKSYDVQVSVDGGAWATWKSATTATGDVYPGEDGRGYAFRVRARDFKGNVSAWNVSTTAGSAPALAAGGFATVTTALTMRASPTTTAASQGTLAAGSLVAITDGPHSADGYTWYEVSGPLSTWQPVGPVTGGVWVAGSSASESWLAAVVPPNTTRTDAVMAGFSIGGTGVSGYDTSTTGRVSRTFSPNGDGVADVMRLAWTSEVALDPLELRVYAANGSLLGTIQLGPTAAGPRSHAWDGRIGGSRVPDGRYLLTLAGKGAGEWYFTPTPGLVSSAQLDWYGVTVAPHATPFTDIAGTFMGDIEWLWFEEITGGCTATRFCTGSTLTRAQMASFLVRVLDLPPAARDYFRDDDGSTHEADINALAAAGITGGCASGRYCPGARVTRGQMASFLARALKLPASPTDHFRDDDGTTHEADIDRIAEAGITGGCAPGRYCPGAGTTRGQMAAFLHRSFGD